MSVEPEVLTPNASEAPHRRRLGRGVGPYLGDVAVTQRHLVELWRALAILQTAEHAIEISRLESESAADAAVLEDQVKLPLGQVRHPQRAFLGVKAEAGGVVQPLVDGHDRLCALPFMGSNIDCVLDG